MPHHWRRDMVVWVNDKDRGTVVIGSYGFVWWAGKKVHCARFEEPQDSPVHGYNKYWQNQTGKHTSGREVLRVFDLGSASHASLLRFVRTGLFP